MAFNSTTAVLAAGFAFEAYNEPSENDARWERGADGIDVAFMSETFAQEVYKGILEVRLCEAKDLEEQDDLAQKLMSGGQRDPYVILAMNEEKTNRVVSVIGAAAAARERREEGGAAEA